MLLSPRLAPHHAHVGQLEHVRKIRVVLDDIIWQHGVVVILLLSGGLAVHACQVGVVVDAAASLIAAACSFEIGHSTRRVLIHNAETSCQLMT